jgi:hypothetical protein
VHTSCHEIAVRGTPFLSPSYDALGKGEKTAKRASYATNRGRRVRGFSVVLRGGLRSNVLTLLPLDGMAVTHHPEVDVGLGVLGESVGESPLAGDLDNGAIDVLVPIRDRVLVGNGLVADSGQPIAVAFDVSPDFVLAAERGGPDIVVGMETIEIGAA